jgi:hypothetical protein
MRKGLFGVIGLAVLLGVLFAVFGTNEAAAEVSVNINLGPPPIVVAEPPEVVLVPRSQVYFVPHQDIDVFFYGGFYWSPRGDRWYRAKAYNGPWGVVERRRVPSYVTRVPRDYRVRYERERRIPYGQWKKGPRHHQKEVRKEMKEHEKDRRGHEREDRGDRGHGR